MKYIKYNRQELLSSLHLNTRKPGDSHMGYHILKKSDITLRGRMSSLEKNSSLFNILTFLKASRESLPIKAPSIFVNAFTSFMGQISRRANNLICKHIEVIRSYAFFAGQQRSSKTNISTLSKQIFPQLSANCKIQQHNQLLEKVLHQIQSLQS